MRINNQTLKETVKNLLKGQDLNDSLDILMADMDELQLQNIIQTILDPTFRDRQNILTRPERFCTNSTVVPQQGVSTEYGLVEVSFDALKSAEQKSTEELREELTNIQITESEAEKIEEIKSTILSNTGVIPKQC